MCRCLPMVGLLTLMLGCGGGDPTPLATVAAPKGAATPEEAVQRLAAAAKAGNVDQLLAQLTPPLAKLKKTMLAIGSEEVVFATVLDGKFGRDITPTPRTFATQGEWRDSLRGLKGIDVKHKETLQPDRVRLTVWEQQAKTVETQVMAVKDADGWKLDYRRVLADGMSQPAQRTGADGKAITVHVEVVGQTDDQAIAVYQQSLDRYRAALAQISQDVAGGRFAKREDADQARQAAATAAFKRQ